MTNPVPADNAPSANLCGCDNPACRRTKLTFNAFSSEMFRDARPCEAAHTLKASQQTIHPLHGRPDSPGVYDLYTPVDEGAYWAARLALATDGSWRIDDTTPAPRSETGANRESPVGEASTSFKERVIDLVHESRDSDDLLIALNILLEDDCSLRPATLRRVPPCCTTHGIVGRRSSSKHD